MVSGIVGAMVMDSTTDVSYSVAAGYRFNRAFGLGVELTAAPSLGRDLSRPFIYPAIPIQCCGQSDAQVTIFTTNVRLEIPTTARRIVPYVVAGGGVANLKETADFYILTVDPLTPILAGNSSSTSFTPETVLPTIFPPRFYPSYVISSTELALTLGAGVGVMATERLSIDLDLRHIRLLSQVDQNIGRFGVGVSYRF